MITVVCLFHVAYAVYCGTFLKYLLEEHGYDDNAPKYLQLYGGMLTMSGAVSLVTAGMTAYAAYLEWQ
jgi:hypothetical protein